MSGRIHFSKNFAENVLGNVIRLAFRRERFHSDAHGFCSIS